MKNLLDMGENTGSDIRLSQLFDVGDEHDREIHFDWSDFLDSVRDDIQALAVYRYSVMLEGREGWVNMLDHDYQPPSPPSSK